MKHIVFFGLLAIINLIIFEHTKSDIRVILSGIGTILSIIMFTLSYI